MSPRPGSFLQSCRVSLIDKEDLCGVVLVRAFTVDGMWARFDENRQKRKVCEGFSKAALR